MLYWRCRGPKFDCLKSHLRGEWPVFSKVIEKMKKIGWRLLIVILLLSGCSANQANRPHHRRSSEATSSSVKKASTAQATSKGSTSVSDDTSKANATVWNQTKTRQLARFMANWQSQMKQSYQGTYNDEKPDHLGNVFPKALKDGGLNGHVKWGEQTVNLTWSTNGENGNAFQVVAVATGGGKQRKSFPTTYFFCLYNQQPVVFMTQTTNGNDLDIQDTQNSALQAGFAKIVTGVKPQVLTNAALNADLTSAVKASPQRWPSAYQGTWYAYDGYEKKITSFSTDTISDFKLTRVKTKKRTWLNVRGGHQSAGAGTFEYVRYHYYDGRQIPVMMRASGAGAWFDENAYQSESIAKQMKDFEFGDESKKRDEEDI